MRKQFQKITLFFNNKPVRRSGRARSYLHFHEVEIIPEDVLKAFAELYEDLSDATLESFKSTATYLTETIGALSANAELYNAGVLIFALSDGEYDSIIIPGIDFSLVLPDNTLDVTTEGEVIAQWMINNNTSPRGGVDVVGFEGGYYAVLRQLNQ